MGRTNSAGALCGKVYPKELELLDDGAFVRYPHIIGRSILLYGTKTGRFPYSCFVGPDFPCMLVTYCLIIGCGMLFIMNIARQWGIPFIIVSVVLIFATLITFSLTACSDPGVVYTKPVSVPLVDMEEGGSPHRISVSAEGGKGGGGGGGGGSVQQVDNDGASDGSSSQETPTVSTAFRRKSEHTSQQAWIECGQCNIDRPRNASHCYECGLCIMELDHHCPWTGKCIGKKTIFYFQSYLWCLCTLLMFVVVMVIVTAATPGRSVTGNM